ncbi:ATP-binding protein [Streptomyces sp. NBC_01283]|uniref:ATP-binding protein n=1 Tax=Streptomyces sp. NBC_01283 TaxID=2903812 RepID=UPI00352EC77F|nr:ATP-binding protein [Streptomyces sp. NBC_01283]
MDDESWALIEPLLPSWLSFDSALSFRLGTLTVHDASTAPPRALPLDASKLGGLGWQLIHELSDDVQIHIHATGMTVTAVVPCSTGVMPGTSIHR